MVLEMNLPKLRCPPSLEELAFEAISTYVSNVAYQFVVPICSKISLTDSRNEEVPENSMLKLDNVEEYLHGSLPQVLAGKMTACLLKAITLTISKTACTTDSFKTSGDSNCRNVIRQFIVICANPHVKRLDLSKEPYIVGYVMCENIHKMLKLEEFTAQVLYDLPNDVQVTCLRNFMFLDNLISFSMERTCTNEVIKVIAKTCKKLKSLKVSGSGYVSDASIDSILEMSPLEQLDLSGTNISERGMAQLLVGLAKGKDPSKSSEAEQSEPQYSTFSMRKLGCGLIRNPLLDILLKYYRNLIHICFCTVDCDLSLLKDMEHLQEVKLSGGNFITDNIKGLVMARGQSLTSIDLLLIQDVDLSCISVHCPQLITLNIRSCSFSTGPVSKKISKVPLFQKLKDFTFYVQCEAEYPYSILIHCLNIQKVVIGLIKEVDDQFVRNVLKENSMQYLEEFKVYFSERLSISTARLLMLKCPNLSTLGGLETWYGVCRVELHRFREELKQKNYKLCVVR